MDRTILLVEDSPIPLPHFQNELREHNWNVLRAMDIQDALSRLETERKAKRRIDIAAIDLGIPPGIDDPFHGGIHLIRTLRAQSATESMPVLAYTSMGVREFDYGQALKILLSLRASFITTRPPIQEKLKFVDAVEYTWMGYVLISPVAADFLNRAIANRPDPLDEKHWETLTLLEQQISYSQIASQMKIGVEGVKARVSRIKEILEDAREIEPDAETEDLVRWYRQNKVRFSRTD